MRLKHFSSSSLLLLLLLEIGRCKFAEIAPKIYLLKLCNGIHFTKLKQDRKKRERSEPTSYFVMAWYASYFRERGVEGRTVFIFPWPVEICFGLMNIHVKIGCNLFCLTMRAVEVCNSRHCFEVEKSFWPCKAICLKQY